MFTRSGETTTRIKVDYVATGSDCSQRCQRVIVTRARREPSRHFCSHHTTFMNGYITEDGIWSMHERPPQRLLAAGPYSTVPKTWSCIAREAANDSSLIPESPLGRLIVGANPHSTSTAAAARRHSRWNTSARHPDASRYILLNM